MSHIWEFFTFYFLYNLLRFLEMPATWSGPTVLLAPCWAIVFRCLCQTESLQLRIYVY